MRKFEDGLNRAILGIFTALTVLLLAFLIYFIFRESLPAIRDVGLKNLLLGSQWRPLIYTDAPAFGMRNMILSTLFVAALAVGFSLIIGVGCALFLACAATDRQRTLVMPYIDLLASIPSVIYGFIGLYIVVKFFEKLGRATGESILAGGIVLSVMILPYMVSSCCDTMVKLCHRYSAASQGLGVNRWYMASQLVLPASTRGILISMALATGRAMGETMAVMIVVHALHSRSHRHQLKVDEGHMIAEQKIGRLEPLHPDLFYAVLLAHQRKAGEHPNKPRQIKGLANGVFCGLIGLDALVIYIHNVIPL